MWKLLLCFCAYAALGKAAQCPNGEKIYEHGMSKDDQKIIIKLHNTLRSKIMNGTVQGQPRGKGLKTMKYDTGLQKIAANLTDSCKFTLKKGKDRRWSWVGLNIHIQYSEWDDLEPDWPRTFNAWAKQRKNFDYDLYVSKQLTHTGYPYTQLVWDSSDRVGCYYTCYHDKTKTDDAPYAKLYACYYGPGGNVLYRPPYKRYKNEKKTELIDSLRYEKSVIEDIIDTVDRVLDY